MFWDIIHGLPIIYSKDYFRDRERGKLEEREGKEREGRRERERYLNIIKDKNKKCDGTKKWDIR